MVWASANSCYQLGNLQMKRLQLLIFVAQIFVTSGFSLKLQLLQSLHENGRF